jgi:hypothetical protein
MHYLVYAIFIYIIAAVNAGIFPALSIWGAIPQLLVLTCTILAITEDDLHLMFFVGLIGGIMWELETSIVPGSLTLGYMLATGIIYLLSRRVFFIQDRVKYLPVFLLSFHLFLVFWVVSINFFAMRLGLSRVPVQFSSYLALALPSFLYSLVFLYPMYILLAQVERFRAFIDRQRRTVK